MAKIPINILTSFTDSLIDWYDYMLMYHYGLHKYILGENVDPPEAADILSRQRLTHFNDVQWAIQ